MLLNNKLFATTSIGALLVMGGVICKNTSEKLAELKAESKLTNTTPKTIKLLKILGVIFFSFGWVITAYALSCKKKYKLLYVVPCVGVLASVLVMKGLKEKHKKEHKKEEFKMPKALPITFIASWVVLGLLCASHLKGLNKLVGLLAPFLVVFSMMFLLPVARRHCLVDGPGNYAFMLAWVLIVVINSCRK